MRRYRLLLIPLYVLLIGLGLPLAMLWLGTGSLRQVASHMLGAAVVIVPVAVLVCIGVAFALFGDRFQKFAERQQRLRPGRWRLVGALATPLIYIAMMAGMGVWQGGSILARLMESLPMVIVFVGCSVIGLGIVQTKVGKYCAKCGYELSPEVEKGADEGSKCPECAHLWMRPKGTTTGRREVHPWPIATGVAIFIGAMLLIISPLRRMPTVGAARWLPTESLIAEVTAAPRGFTMDQWAQLNQRTLTQEQRVRLAEGLLELRRKKQYLARDAETWMEAAAFEGSLPAPIIDRYFGEMLQAELIASMDAGGGAHVKVRASHRGSLGTPGVNLKCFVAFEGFRVGEQKGLERRDRLEHAILFASEKHGPPPAIDAVIPEGKAIEVAAAYWIVVAPGNIPQQIRWKDDGTPDLPATVVWSKRYETTTRVSSLGGVAERARE